MGVHKNFELILIYRIDVVSALSSNNATSALLGPSATQNGKSDNFQITYRLSKNCMWWELHCQENYTRPENWYDLFQVAWALGMGKWIQWNQPIAYFKKCTCAPPPRFGWDPSPHIPLIWLRSCSSWSLASAHFKMPSSTVPSQISLRTVTSLRGGESSCSMPPPVTVDFWSLCPT